MTLVTLQPTHYPVLYDITKVTDIWVARTPQEHNEFFSKCSGWVVEHKGKVVGYIILMNHIPYMDIHIHCSVLPEYQSKWMTRKIYATVFNTIFKELLLPRCTSYIIDGYSHPTFLSRLGFKQEGTVRKGYIVGDKWCDVHLYSMLAEEQRWK